MINGFVEMFYLAVCIVLISRLLNFTLGSRIHYKLLFADGAIIRHVL
jgi:hypothetical protein